MNTIFYEDAFCKVLIEDMKVYVIQGRHTSIYDCCSEMEAILIAGPIAYKAKKDKLRKFFSFT